MRLGRTTAATGAIAIALAACSPPATDSAAADAGADAVRGACIPADSDAVAPAHPPLQAPPPSSVGGFSIDLGDPSIKDTEVAPGAELFPCVVFPLDITGPSNLVGGGMLTTSPGLHHGNIVAVGRHTGHPRLSQPELDDGQQQPGGGRRPQGRGRPLRVDDAGDGERVAELSVRHGLRHQARLPDRRQSALPERHGAPLPRSRSTSGTRSTPGRSRSRSTRSRGSSRRSASPRRLRRP